MTSRSMVSSSGGFSLFPWRWRSLRWQLLSLLGLTLLCTLAILGIIVHRYITAVEQRLWQSRQEDAAHYAAGVLARDLADHQSALTLIAELGADEFEENAHTLQNLLPLLPGALELLYLDADGRIGAAAHLDEGLLEAIAGDEAGQAALLATYDAPFISILQGGRFGPRMDEPMGSPQDNAHGPFVLVTARSRDGAAVVSRLRLQTLWEGISQLPMPTATQMSASIYIVQNDGLILAHTNQELVGRRINLDDVGMAEAGRYLNVEQTSVVGATAPVTGADWLVVAEAPQTATYAISRVAVRLIGGGVTLVGLLNMAVLGYFLYRMILRPLARLRTGAERIGQGDLRHRIPIQQADEVNQVAVAFNQMIAHLADREEALHAAQTELESRVQERTAALAAANQDLRAEVEVRRATEDALRASELRYRTLFETSPVGIFTKDLTGRYTSANTAEMAYWAFPPVGFSDHEMLPAPEATREQASDRTVIESGESIVVEQQRQAGQQVRTVLIYKTPLLDGNGMRSGILGVALDITERRQAELALREAEARFRALVEQMPAITYTAALDDTSSALYISPQISMLGFSPEEWVSDPERFVRQVHPDDVDRVLAEVKEMRATGKPLQSEYRIFTRDRKMLWVSDQANLIYDHAGKPVCSQGIMFDITQRKEVEEALYDSVQRMRLIADNLPALIAYIDKDQLYQFANRQFEEWYATPDIAGKHLSAIAGEQQYLAIADYVQMALSGTPITFDYARTYPDGRRRFVEISYIPHITADGDVSGFFTLVQDLTERMEAEEQIKASLEEKVVLLKEIHHRVKNNLQVVSSLLYLQAEQITDPHVRAILQDSQNRVKSMALIHEKLYQAKDQVRVDVAEYIRNLTSYLFRSYTEQAGGVRLVVRADDIHLGIDTAMPCGLIINELFSNALKHAFPAGRSGEINVELRRDDDGAYTLSVRDNGVGLPHEIDLYKTTSLGLQLVHTLVHQIDGRLELHRNGGTEFCIRFADAHM